MKFTVTEWHQVALEKTYEISEEEAIEEFGSVQRLKEIISQQEQETWGGMDPEGEDVTDEESDKFWEWTWNSDYESEEDWWTMSKGGYDITVSIEEE
jgi:hypothetical protein